MINKDLQARRELVPSQSITFTIRCGDIIVTRAITAYLETQGFRYSPDAELVILVDTPRSFAMNTLKRLEHPFNRVVIVIGTAQPEYIADLLDLQPNALLIESDINQDISNAIAHATSNKQNNSSIITRLTFAERKVLHYVACGYDDKGIAAHLTVKPQSVSNTLSRILGKLELKNRTQAALYYWGIWHSLRKVYEPDG